MEILKKVKQFFKREPKAGIPEKQIVKTRQSKRKTERLKNQNGIAIQKDYDNRVEKFTTMYQQAANRIRANYKKNREIAIINKDLDFLKKSKDQKKEYFNNLNNTYTQVWREFLKDAEVRNPEAVKDKNHFLSIILWN